MSLTITETSDVIVKQAIKEYEKIYENKCKIVTCAPGRVNLIGEHVDYNDGYVLPMALPMVTVIAGSPRYGEHLAKITTLCDGADEPYTVEFNIKNVCPGEPKWLNYIKGVISGFNYEIPGFNAVIMTNVPIGGGLSSSAALEVATLKFLQALIGQNESTLDHAKICQKAEHEFAGMPCGIMDQLISLMGKKNNALLIDCSEKLTIEHIPFVNSSLSVLICNSNVRHKLSDSEYPTRRRQCNEALQIMGFKSYRDATIDSLHQLDGVLLKRARHVITEIQRTKLAADALKTNNFVMMGRLMKESHKSLGQDFEVSCPELDCLVEAANNCVGVLGSRMTGGGFGGCTVTLVKKSHILDVYSKVNEVYRNKFNGCLATFFVCEPSQGAQIVEML